MAYRNVFEIQKPWALEVVRCINEWWANMVEMPMNDRNEFVHNWVTEPMSRWTNESMNQRINESMKQQRNDSMIQPNSEPMDRWISESKTQWISASMTQWIGDSVSQWINESMHKWTSESMTQWLSESMNQWITDSVNHWINESMNLWTYEPMNQWVRESMNLWNNESMNQRMKGSTHGRAVRAGRASFLYFLCWASSSLSDLFAEAPLLSATSSLSSLLSGLLLLWPCSELPPAMNSRSYYDAFSNLQLQSRYSTKVALWSRTTFRAAVTLCLATSSCKPTCHNHLPEGSQHHSCFAALSRANAFCHSRLQARKAGASDQIDQHSRSPDSGDDSALLREWRFFHDFYAKSSSHLQSHAHFADLIFQECPERSRYSLVHIFPNWSSKSAPTVRTRQFVWHFEEQPSSRYSPVRFLSTTFRDRNWDSISATLGATFPEKHRVSRPIVFSPVNSHASELLHFPTTWWWVVGTMMWLTWWCECQPWPSSVTRKFSN